MIRRRILNIIKSICAVFKTKKNEEPVFHSPYQPPRKKQPKKKSINRSMKVPKTHKKSKKSKQETVKALSFLLMFFLISFLMFLGGCTKKPIKNTIEYIWNKTDHSDQERSCENKNN